MFLCVAATHLAEGAIICTFKLSTICTHLNTVSTQHISVYDSCPHISVECNIGWNMLFLPSVSCLRVRHVFKEFSIALHRAIWRSATFSLRNVFQKKPLGSNKWLLYLQLECLCIPLFKYNPTHFTSEYLSGYIKACSLFKRGLLSPPDLPWRLWEIITIEGALWNGAKTF